MVASCYEDEYKVSYTDFLHTISLELVLASRGGKAE
jgi:hypothetical protein